jgi:hypothetical protein
MTDPMLIEYVTAMSRMHPMAGYRNFFCGQT